VDISYAGLINAGYELFRFSLLAESSASRYVAVVCTVKVQQVSTYLLKIHKLVTAHKTGQGKINFGENCSTLWVPPVALPTHY